MGDPENITKSETVWYNCTSFKNNVGSTQTLHEDQLTGRDLGTAQEYKSHWTIPIPTLP